MARYKPLTPEQIRHSRIRRVKRLLRYMPRKTTLDRYPILKFFASWARKRHYLWSFRSKEVIPALYAGWILTLVPVYGFHISLAFLLALIFRANLMILVGLQFVSNPLTIIPIYALDYYVGDFFMHFLGSFDNSAVKVFELETGSRFNGFVGVLSKYSYYVIAMFVGGTILGYFCGLLSSIFYKIATKRFEKENKNYKHGKSRES